MPRSIVKIAKSRRKLRSVVADFFRNPLNSSMIALLAAGVIYSSFEFGIFLVAATVIADIANAYIDPRIRY